MCDIAHIAGLVIAGLHVSPVPHAPFVTTTTHKTLRGPRGGLVLCRADRAKDLDRNVFPGIQGGPLEHVIAAKAVAFAEAATPEFVKYQKRVVENARALAGALTARGFRLVSGGTDNHLMLVDVGAKGISGKDAEKLLEKVGLTVNKNTIPFDTRSPMVASGIRLGTPAVTTRGMGVAEMDVIGGAIVRTLEAREDAAVHAEVRRTVSELCAAYPLGVSRAGAAGAAAGILLVLVLVAQPWGELPRRARSVARFASRELAVRRLGGSGAAFDRKYYSFLENARRRLPASAEGVALYGVPPSDAYLHLASYVFAPRPVRMAPESPPPGWVAAIYGAARPPDARILQEWDEGALVVREPGPAGP